jgi:hypothetical protein
MTYSVHDRKGSPLCKRRRSREDRDAIAGTAIIPRCVAHVDWHRGQFGNRSVEEDAARALTTFRNRDRILLVLRMSPVCRLIVPGKAWSLTMSRIVTG